LNSLNGS